VRPPGVLTTWNRAEQPCSRHPGVAAAGLVWIGSFSYSLYLIHAPLIQVLWQYVFHPPGPGDTATYLLLLLIGGPLIVLAAWGFWWACERPFLNSRVSTARVQRAREDLQSAAV
jgi:peptidoglycan/LPS O-acetylase OafA/YrhL